MSANAIRALNGGAWRLLPRYRRRRRVAYHREGGGDIIWEIGSGYFRRAPGRHLLAEVRRRGDQTAGQDGRAEAQPGRQARPRRRPAGAEGEPGNFGDAAAPTGGLHIAVRAIRPSTPIEMMHFIAEMRRLSGGKPAGFKLCIGHEWEFLAICKAMIETGIYPDFIVVDGKEGRHRRRTDGIHRPYRQADAPGPSIS